MKKLLHFISTSNIYIASCAFGLSLFCDFLLHPFRNFSIEAVHLFIFFATLFTYTYHRIFSSGNIRIRTYFSLFISSLASLLFFLFMDQNAMIVSTVLGIICFLYPLRMINGVRLRSIPYLKTILIAMVWAFAVVILPELHQSEGSIDTNAENTLILFGLIALFVFAEAFSFDIRDIQTDQKSGLATIANKLGLNRSKQLNAVLFFLASIGMVAFSLSTSLSSPFVYGLLIPMLLGAVLTLNINKNRSELYFNIGIESILILPLVILMVIQLFLP